MQHNTLRNNAQALALIKTRARVSDGGGLHLLRLASGTYWRMDYTFEGKRRTIRLGTVGKLSLDQARQCAEGIRKLIQDGRDPVAERRAARQLSRSRDTAFDVHEFLRDGYTFADVAMEWLNHKRAYISKGHAEKTLCRIRRHLLKDLGDKRIALLTTREYTTCLLEAQNSAGPDTARRLLQIAKAINDFGRANGYVTTNPVDAVKQVLRPAKARHRAAVTTPADLQTLVERIDGFGGDFVTKCALQLLLMTFLRPGELRNAKWSEISFAKATWTVPGERMKRSQARKAESDHIVALAPQAISILQSLNAHTGHRDFVFAGSGRKRGYMSENTLTKALRSMGYCTKTQMSAHGVRATARTLIAGELGFDRWLIELQLDHIEHKPHRHAYDRAPLLDERREMLLAWATYLESLHPYTRTTVITAPCAAPPAVTSAAVSGAVAAYA